MIHNQLRIGNFTSSEIGNLMSNGKKKGSIGAPAYTYIEEKKMERRLGRSLQRESGARELSWGKFLEDRVFELLGIDYELVSKDTLSHPKYSYWSGSPDANKYDEERTVIDIKCPIDLKSFCRLVDPLYDVVEMEKDEEKGIWIMEKIKENHPAGKMYYWQLVSNSILTSSVWGELIVYCPYKSELEEIRESASGLDSNDQYKYYWIGSATDDEMPYLVDGGYYKNLNVIRFRIPEKDKKALEERVVKCAEIGGMV